MTEQEQAELYRLADSLPEETVPHATVDALVAERGFEFARRRLIEAHSIQCRTLCTHFARSSDELSSPAGLRRGTDRVSDHSNL